MSGSAEALNANNGWVGSLLWLGNMALKENISPDSWLSYGVVIAMAAYVSRSICFRVRFDRRRGPSIFGLDVVVNSVSSNVEAPIMELVKLG